MASLEKPLYTSLPNISIEILDCIEDAELIEEYKGYATEQKIIMKDNIHGILVKRVIRFILF